MPGVDLGFKKRGATETFIWLRKVTTGRSNECVKVYGYAPQENFANLAY